MNPALVAAVLGMRAVLVVLEASELPADALRAAKVRAWLEKNASVEQPFSDERMREVADALIQETP